MVRNTRILATLAGAATAIIFTPLSTVLVSELTESEVVEGSCKKYLFLYAHNDCLAAVGIGWIFHVGAACALIGVLLGACVGFVVYRRLSASPIQ